MIVLVDSMSPVVTEKRIRHRLSVLFVPSREPRNAEPNKPRVQRLHYGSERRLFVLNLPRTGPLDVVERSFDNQNGSAIGGEALIFSLEASSVIGAGILI